MASYYKSGATWTVAYDGRLDGKPKGRRGYIYGIRTKRLAEQSKVKKDAEEQLLKAGLLTVDAGAARARRQDEKKIEEHVAAFEKSILARGKHPRHAQQTAGHVRRLFTLAGIARLSQMDPEKIQAAARSLMETHDLAPRTANAAIKAARQFSTWCDDTHRTQTDLLHRRLTTFNEEHDVRRKRRALSAEEFAWLTEHTASHGNRGRSGIPAADRAMLYQVALGTGFRQAALLSLTPESFSVGERQRRPGITLGARFNKNGKERFQPIRHDLAERLRAWLKDREPKAPVWRLRPHADLAITFRRDTERARKAWIAAAQTPAQRQQREASTFLQYVYHDGVRNVYADFHGLRHTGITLVVRHAGLKVGQAWADHSTPVLTAKYAHMELLDEAKALEALPETAQAPDLARKPGLAGSVRVISGSRKIG